MNLFSFNSAISADLMYSTIDIKSIKLDDIITSESSAISIIELEILSKSSFDFINLLKYKSSVLHINNLNTIIHSIQNK